tara:strand:- start:419 stop:1042 length:624 start_codon:yes stop_codon:yes gene_type:complete
MENSFWLNNPKVLLNNRYIQEIWPQKDYSFERKLNAITRIVIALSGLGYLFTKSIKILISLIVTLIVLVIIYKSKKPKKLEPFNVEGVSDSALIMPELNTMPTDKNPFMNVLVNEYAENPERKKAAPLFNKNIENKVKDIMIKKNPQLYKNLGDNLALQHSLRNFHSMPNTTIPNAQKEFALFCYGGMKSCKDGDDFECLKNTATMH